MDEKKELAVVNDNSTETNESTDIDVNDLVVKFNKPYLFERVEYTEISLDGLNDLTAEDMIAVDRILKRNSGFGVDIMPEVSMEYAINIAARATKKPVEFFNLLPPKEAIKVKNRVTAFLFGSE